MQGRSESAIMTSAEQARFRIDRPNSRPRATLVIALDARGAAALGALRDDRSWNGARFLRYGGARRASQHLPSLRIDAIVLDEAGNELSLMKQLAGVDAVIMLTATDAAEAAEIIGNACAARGIAATGLVLAPEQGAEALGQIVATLRPHTAMLVVSSSDDYAAEMLSALRA